MIFLDANAFYWYFGRDKLRLSETQQIEKSSLDIFLNSQTKKSIPTSVFMEIITHFRDDPCKIRSILSFIDEKNIKIYNNFINYCISNEELRYVSLMNENDLLGYADNILNKKVKIEAGFATFFLETTRLLYLEYKGKSLTGLSNKQNNILKHCLARKINKINIKKYKKLFFDVLKQGYKNSDEDKVLKNSYIDSLTEECVFINLYIELFYHYKDKNVDLIKVIQNRYQSLVSVGLDLNATDKKIMENIVNELSVDLGYLNYAENRICSILKKNRFSTNQSEYIKEILLPAWLERGQKYRKNDIFDMFCIGVLDYKESTSNILIDTTPYLLSFDKTMKRYIKTHSKSSYELIKKFDLKEASL